MMSPDSRHLEAWDSDYRSRGLLWGGSPAPLPGLPKGSRVLELGCGNGKNLPGMIEKGWDITAMDCSINALLLCRPVIHEAGRVHFVAGDIVSLPFRDATIDAVFSLHVAGHLAGAGRSQFAGELLRVLKPGGQIVFRDFGTDDFRYGKGEMTEPGTFRRGAGSFTHYFTGDEVTRLFSAFYCISIDDHRWSMRIKGQDYQRSEITAIFEKST
jgi:MPBQ/MSBQ methyltransferase